jgi:phosphoribosyl 1,2-cyclic phosphodiesterase
MSISFRSICSSSSGNCLALWSDTTRLIIDCGLSSMKRTRHALTSIFRDPAQIDSVLLTHMHGDHISYYPLKVLEDYGLSIHLHDNCMDQLKDKHFNGYGFKDLNLNPFKKRPFTIGDFCIRPFEVAHNPWYPTCGYQVQCQDKKMVFVTDFLNWQNVFEYFIDADFIFVESNHDLELLRKYFNPNSQFHMPNPDTAELLVTGRKESRKAPQMVMLGHLSDQRNDAKIALKETRDAFREAGIKMDFELKAAPLKEAGQVIRIK